MQNYQGILKDRYKVVPRVLIFVFKGNDVLLQKGALGKRLWANLYNGVGGHIERGEDLLAGAYREFNEETGLQKIHLQLCGSVIIDADQYEGVMLFIFGGKYQSGEIKSSSEGKIEWVDEKRIKDLPTMPDLSILLEQTKLALKSNWVFHGQSWYDKNGILRIAISNLEDSLKKEKQS